MATDMPLTPSALAAILNSHSIGADAPGGSGTIKDRSLDGDWSEVLIAGTYDLSEAAQELSDALVDTDTHRQLTVYRWACFAALVALVVSLVMR